MKIKKISLKIIFLIILSIVVLLYTLYWRNHTVTRFEEQKQGLMFVYISQRKQFVPYQHIQDIKFVIPSSDYNRMCRLKFYLKDNQVILTQENIPCENVNVIRNSILRKANRPQYDLAKILFEKKKT